ncbi:MAG TPA: metalloregulator ArsR/SmtB family transcription factor [Anaerolineales bacterium]
MNEALEREINQLHAEFCAGLADAKRLMILYTLAEKSATVNEIAAVLHIGQPAASRHLKMLRTRGMVIATRQGASIEYRLADARLIEALDTLRAVMRDHLSHSVDIVGALENS